MANVKTSKSVKKESVAKKAPTKKATSTKKGIKLGGVPNQGPVPKSSDIK